MNYRIDAYLTANRVVDASQTFVMQLSQYVTGMQFTSSIQGGFLSATLDLACSQVIAWDLLSNHLGQRVVLVNPHASNVDMIVWEGLLYGVTVDDGKSVVNRSLANVYNRVTVTYSVITFDGSGNPVFGAQTTTAAANDTASQALYGIRELNYVIGGTDATSAAALRDTLLIKYKNPLATQQSARRGGGGDPSQMRVTLECAGIYETLDKGFYASATTGNANIDVIVKATLTSVAQFASSDQSNVAVNTQQRTQYSQGNVTAQTFIDGLSALGGPNNRRYYFGFYEQGLPYYVEEPTAVAYRARRLDPSEAIYDAATGSVVPPWLVRPNNIIRIDDLVPDAVSYASTLSDPRAFLIGEVIFTAPALVEITPYTGDPAQLSLARMGLSAIGG